MKRFTLGFIIGGVICSALTGFAVEYAVTANPFPIKVDGVAKSIEGYNIQSQSAHKPSHPSRQISTELSQFTKVSQEITASQERVTRSLRRTVRR